MTTTVEQRVVKRALLLAGCCVALTLATAATVEAAHASAHDAGAQALLAPGAGFDGRQQAAVSRLQRRLLGLGYAPGPVDGFYGPLTTAAVRRMQAANGLAVDGIAGPRTRRAVRAQARPQPAQVKRVQRKLRSLGHRPGPVDGIFGPRTVQALRRFQHAEHLAGPARLTAATLARLNLTSDATRPATQSPAPHQTPTPTPAPPAAAPPQPQPQITTTPPGTVTPDPVATPAAVATVTPHTTTTTTTTAPDPQTVTAHATPSPSPPASPSPVPTLQDTGRSASLTLQIAVIVAVMVLIAVWPFRRANNPTTHEREEDPLKGPGVR